MSTLDELRSVGLTENEARTYVALLRFGRQTPAELAPRARVSRGRIYQVLSEVERKGFAIEVPGSKRSFEAVEPHAALEAVLDDRNARLRAEQQLIESLVPTLESIGKGSMSSLPAVEILRRPEQIARRFMQLQTEAEREILVFTKPPYVSEDNPAEMGALARRIRYAVVYEATVFDDPAYTERVRQWNRAGEQARVVDGLPAKMAVFDRSVALLPILSSELSDLPFTPVVVHDVGLAQTLALAFDHVWETAQPLSISEGTPIDAARADAPKP